MTTLHMYIPGRTAIFVVTIIVACSTFHCGRHHRPADLDTKDIEPTPGFLFTDTMSGTILKSTNAESIGEKLTFIGLSSSSPRVNFYGTGVTSPMQKLNETEHSVVLQLFTGGSFDTFIINKKSGLFTRTYCGTMPGDDLYSGCAIGICK